jgi:transforming growth factor-beta-induced protein
MRTPLRARTVALAGIATLTLLAAACGSDDNDATPATTGAAAAAPSATTPMSSTPMSSDPMTSMPASGAAMMEPTGSACSSVPTDGEGSFAGMADDPAATAASNNPQLSTLVAAVKAADLVDTLNSAGPFTIFAPINSAFEKIPKADLDAVLADKATLTSILTYHVVAGQMSSADLAAAGKVTTVNGAELTIAKDGDSLTINGDEAKVVCQDIPTANATVYLIDSVLMPPA